MIVLDEIGYGSLIVLTCPRLVGGFVFFYAFQTICSLFARFFDVDMTMCDVFTENSKGKILLQRKISN